MSIDIYRQKKDYLENISITSSVVKTTTSARQEKKSFL